MASTSPWLPTGAHWSLNIEHSPAAEDAGPFTVGRRKLVWHTTESGQESVDAMVRVLHQKRAAPHFVYGYRQGYKFPVVVQMVPLNRAARALMHPSGPPTNAARASQVEICGRAAESDDWDDDYYKGLANLAGLIRQRTHFRNVVPRDFTVPASRYTGLGFVLARGHVGHCHVPGNDHWDPGRFRAHYVRRLMEHLPQQLNPR
jgi:N-acetylmuramoyl-L-alanine amidase